MPEHKPCTLLIADDHPIMRSGLRGALEATGECVVIAEAQNGDEAVRCALEKRPDVIVMDAIMEPKDGISAAHEITQDWPEARILILTASSSEDVIIKAVAAGASGFLRKYSKPEALLNAVQLLVAGKLVIPEATIREVFRWFRSEHPLLETGDRTLLSERERNVIRRFAQGESYTDIAKSEELSTATVRNIMYRVQAKLRVGTKQEVIVWASRSGILDNQLSPGD